MDGSNFLIFQWVVVAGAAVVLSFDFRIDRGRDSLRPSYGTASRLGRRGLSRPWLDERRHAPVLFHDSLGVQAEDGSAVHPVRQLYPAIRLQVFGAARRTQPALGAMGSLCAAALLYTLGPRN